MISRARFKVQESKTHQLILFFELFFCHLCFIEGTLLEMHKPVCKR